MEGEVVEAFPNGMFKIQLDAGHEVLGYTAGELITEDTALDSVLGGHDLAKTAISILIAAAILNAVSSLSASTTSIKS